MTAPTTPDILRGAVRILDERGWYQGGWYLDADGCAVCVLGALALAAGLTLDPRQDQPDPAGVEGPEAAVLAWEDAFEALRESLPPDERWLSVDQWNDDEARTVEQVRAALLAAADDVDLCLAEGGDGR